MTDELNGADNAHGESMLLQLSSLVDDELSAADRAAVEIHLDSCEQCRVTLKGLREVKVWVSSDAATPADRAASAGWSHLRYHLRSRSAGARLGAWSRVSIAATVLIIVAASVVWWKMPSAPSPLVTESPAVATLETLAQEGLATLTPAKSQALRSSLRIIDSAIADAHAARLADPTNDFVATYLDDLLKQKADALREVVEMAGAQSSL
jgi:hypothetical protein